VGGPSLAIEILSTAFAGLEAAFYTFDAELSALTPMASALFAAAAGKEQVRLGQTLQEIGGSWNGAFFSDSPEWTVTWQGRKLAIAGHNGGPGDGANLTSRFDAFHQAALKAYESKEAKAKVVLIQRAQRVANAVRSDVERARNPSPPPGLLGARLPMAEYVAVDAVVKTSELRELDPNNGAPLDAVLVANTWYVKLRVSPGNVSTPVLAEYILVAVEEQVSGGEITFLKMTAISADEPAAPFTWVSPLTTAPPTVAKPERSAKELEAFAFSVGPRIEEAMGNALNETLSAQPASPVEFMARKLLAIAQSQKAGKPHG